MTFNILFCGDVVGKSGRQALQKYLPFIQDKHNIHTTIVNGENSAGGFGITEKICQEILNLNVDIITLGNHSFDKIEIKEYLKNNFKLLRPYNYKEDIGPKYYTYIKENTRITVVSFLGKLFMHSKEPFIDPFIAINNFLQEIKLQLNTDIIIVDFHAETTSEKNAMGLFVDGRVTAILGTHTHIPTADYRLLKNGTAYQTDVGMCGDYDSVIGMTKESSLSLFLKDQTRMPLNVATNPGTLCATVININTTTFKAENIYSVVVGANLKEFN